VVKHGGAVGWTADFRRTEREPVRDLPLVCPPLARLGLAIAAVLAFNYHWNGFYRPLMISSSANNPTFSVFISDQRPLREGSPQGTSK
jgi:multiple sugar transport system permease protein